MSRGRFGSTYIKDGKRQIRVVTDRPGATRPRWIRPCPTNADGSPMSEVDARKLVADLQRAYDRYEWDPWAPTKEEEEKKAPVAEMVAQYADRWLDARERKGLRTVHTDRGYMRNHILPVIGHLPFVEVSARDARRLVASLDDKVSSEIIAGKTALNIWACALRMFSDACQSKRDELRVRQDNPCAGVEGPERTPKKSKAYLYPSECAALLACEDVPLHWRRIFALAVYTYARAGELEALLWSDINLVHGTIHIHSAADRETGEIRETKTGITRRMPIEAELLPLLRAMHGESRSRGRVIPRMPPREEGASKLRASLKAAGVTRAELFITDRTRKNLTFHDLRATGITWCAIRGDDPIKIQRRAGHEDLSTTQGYIREAENVREGFGSVFPPLPAGLLSIAPPNAPMVPLDPYFTEEILRKPGRPQPDSNPLDIGQQTSRVDISTGYAGDTGHLATQSDPCAPPNAPAGAQSDQSREPGR